MLDLSPEAGRVKKEVCGSYGMAMDEMERSRRGISNEPRNAAICLLRTLRGEDLEKVGREFKVTRFSFVSSDVERMRGKISGNRQLRRQVGGMKIALQMSQA